MAGISPGRGAGCWGAAARSTAYFMCAGKPKISIIGGNWATPAGRGKMFCPISNAQRRGRAMAPQQSRARQRRSAVRLPDPLEARNRGQMARCRRRAGYKRNPDYNGSDQEGVGYFQLTLDKGRRCSSAVAYLKPARNRKNLTIITHAQAEKLLLKRARPRALLPISKAKAKPSAPAGK